MSTTSKGKVYLIIMLAVGISLFACGDSEETPTPMPNTPTSEATLEATATPDPTPEHAADLAYLDCCQEVLKDGIDVANTGALVLGMASEQPLQLCVLWDGSGVYEAMWDVRNRADECPLPTMPCVLEHRELILQALDQEIIGTGMIEKWCRDGANALDISLLVSSGTHWEAAGQLMQQATNVLAECEVD